MSLVPTFLGVFNCSDASVARYYENERFNEVKEDYWQTATFFIFLLNKELTIKLAQGARSVTRMVSPYQEFIRSVVSGKLHHISQTN